MPYFIIKGWYGEKEQPTPTPITPVAWSTGTDAEIATMLEAHYAGTIDIYDYWDVGDERTITLSGINDGVDETIVMVLMNKGGKTLNTPINNHTECAFIVGQKDCLSFTKSMNSTDTNVGGWGSSELRTWCNSTYKNSFPSTIINIFKPYINDFASSSNTMDSSVDYFAFEAAKEIGSVGSSPSIEYSNLSTFEYYTTSNNRIKKKNGTDSIYWTRSIRNNNNTDFLYIGVNGNSAPRKASLLAGIAPFGVI